MKSVLALCFSVVLCSYHVVAVEWHNLRYAIPKGSQVTSFSGTMVIPPLPRAAFYYLWPGIQPDDHSGVYQNVLDGRRGSWWMAGGWCCKNPQLPWGDGFGVDKGETVLFSNVQGAKGSSVWTTTLTKTSTGLTTKNTFDLPGKVFNQVIFAIELHGPSWDFGPLSFRDITITTTGTDTSWCNNTPKNLDVPNPRVVGAHATSEKGVITCRISSITMQPATSPKPRSTYIPGPFAPPNSTAESNSTTTCPDSTPSLESSSTTLSTSTSQASQTLTPTPVLSETSRSSTLSTSLPTSSSSSSPIDSSSTAPTTSSIPSTSTSTSLSTSSSPTTPSTTSSPTTASTSPSSTSTTDLHPTSTLIPLPSATGTLIPNVFGFGADAPATHAPPLALAFFAVASSLLLVMTSHLF